MYVQCILAVCIIFILSLNANGDDPSENELEFFGNLTDKNSPSLHLIHYGKKSYYIGDVFMGNFFHSEQFCRKHGMNLISINSMEENDFIHQKLLEKGNGPGHFWTSGTRLPDSQKWIWFTTGNPISYYNWNSGEPNNAKKNEDCIEIRQVNNQLKWNDIDCYRDFNFICEITWTKDCYKLLETIKNNQLQYTNITNLIDIRSGKPAAE